MDERIEEIQVLQSIYPELLKWEEEVGSNVISGEIQIPINLVNPISVYFQNDDSPYKLTHLPPITFKFILPPEYPINSPPKIKITTSWLTVTDLELLEQELLDQFYYEQILYLMIDLIFQRIETVFGYESLEFSNPAMKTHLLNFELSASEQEFSEQSFQCDICQSKKKGSLCTKLQNCGDIFCTECLTGYFVACIDQGYINQVICPQPGCKSPNLNKSQIVSLVGKSKFDRWENLKKKQEIQTDPNTAIICPRNFCQALIKRNPDDNLTICDKCDFAFCAICKRSWHGYFDACRIPEPTIEIIEQYIDGDDLTRAKIEASWGKNNMNRKVREYECDLDFKEYMEQQNNRECPKCSAPIERAMGCNKITCVVCSTFFCFLCGQKLDKQNPYDHYGSSFSPCYRKLFEHTEIDEG